MVGFAPSGCVRGNWLHHLWDVGNRRSQITGKPDRRRMVVERRHRNRTAELGRQQCRGVPGQDRVDAQVHEPDRIINDIGLDFRHRRDDTPYHVEQSVRAIRGDPWLRGWRRHRCLFRGR